MFKRSFIEQAVLVAMHASSAARKAINRLTALQEEVVVVVAVPEVAVVVRCFSVDCFILFLFFCV